MMPPDELLAAAEQAGLTLKWEQDKIRIRGPNTAADTARAILARKADFAACGQCSAVIVAGTTHCKPPAPAPPPAHGLHVVLTWCYGCGTQMIVLPDAEYPARCMSCVGHGKIPAPDHPDPPAVTVRMKKLEPGIPVLAECPHCNEWRLRDPTKDGSCQTFGHHVRAGNWNTACVACGRAAAPGYTMCLICAKGL